MQRPSCELKLTRLCLWSATWFTVLEPPTGSLPHTVPLQLCLRTCPPRRPTCFLNRTPFPMALLHRGHSLARPQGPSQASLHSLHLPRPASLSLPTPPHPQTIHCAKCTPQALHPTVPWPLQSCASSCTALPRHLGLHPPGPAHTALGCQPAPPAWGHSMPCYYSTPPAALHSVTAGAPGGQGVARRQAKWTGSPEGCPRGHCG